MDNYQSEIPEHLPVDMAIAPDRKPYENTRIRAAHNEEQNNSASKLAQHSLSPEKLGVVGYVKDVAGFVKDAMQERRENRRIQRRSSASYTEEMSSSSQQNRVGHGDGNREQRRKSSAEHIFTTSATGATKAQTAPNERTPFAEVVTGLFPGVGEHGPGCTHADELRSQMKHIHDEQSNKLI